MRRTRSRPPADRGSVTVEAAVAVSAVVVVLALCLAGIGCAIAQVQCVDAAREVARQLARGDDAAARSALGRVGPAGARLEVGGDAGTVVVTVRGSPIGGLLPVTLSATAVAVREPHADTAGGP